MLVFGMLFFLVLVTRREVFFLPGVTRSGYPAPAPIFLFPPGGLARKLPRIEQNTSFVQFILSFIVNSLSIFNVSVAFVTVL